MFKPIISGQELNHQALSAARAKGAKHVSKAQELRAKRIDILEINTKDPSAKTLRSCMNAQFGSITQVGRILFGSDRIGVRLVGNIVMTRFHLRRVEEDKRVHEGGPSGDADYRYTDVTFKKLRASDFAKVSKEELLSAIREKLEDYRDTGESGPVVEAGQWRND